ncbi:transposable element Tc1 transposase [Trichonephila clavipes]|nr:transposable element Tc1 transposase [Trichonephila clavipes]
MVHELILPLQIIPPYQRVDLKPRQINRASSLLRGRKGKNAVQARKKLTDVYGEGVLTVRQCQNWFAKFRSGNFDVEDAPRSGRLIETDKDAKKASVDANRRITTQRNLCRRIDVCDSHLKRHENDSFLKRIITGDEKGHGAKKDEPAQTISKADIHQKKEDFGKRNMPGKRARRHSTELSEFERGLIIGMKTASWSTCRVARQVDRSECAVRNCWEQWTLEEEANLKSKRPFRALPLTPEHRQLRLQWYKARSMWNVTDWQKAVFSDESRFVLGSDDNRVRVWRRPGER